MKCVLDNDRFDRAVLRAIQRHDVGKSLRVCPTGPAPAEATTPERSLLTRPAVHATSGIPTATVPLAGATLVGLERDIPPSLGDTLVHTEHLHCVWIARAQRLLLFIGQVIFG